MKSIATGSARPFGRRNKLTGSVSWAGFCLDLRWSPARSAWVQVLSERYDGVDLEILWRLGNEELPRLIAQIDEILQAEGLESG